MRSLSRNPNTLNQRFGSLDLRPAKDHLPNSFREVWDWDSQLYTGRIPEVPHTLNVVGNINEVGVAIIETTWGGRADLDGHGTGAIMSYGDLMFTTLQRATTAREAIRVMDELVQTYGYESDGESFGVADGDEVWLMELVGKGKYGKGAVWVASRVPEGMVGSTANQARTTTFAQNDPANVLFSPDVVSFAKQIGAYPANAPDADFNFREAYDPITFGGARFGEARVWNIFHEVCGDCVNEHLDFALGYNLSNSMPLFVPVVKKLSLLDTVGAMRTHFEDTFFDNRGLILNRSDVGANSGHSPYRFRPLVWQHNNESWLNERTVGIQQSGWAFIASLRNWMPAPFKAVEFFAPDESSTSPRTPVYGGATRIPCGFGSLVGQTPGGGVACAPVADAFTMSLDSAFWIWNLVGNIAFSERYATAYPMVLDKVDALQAAVFEAVARTDADVVALWPVDAAAAIELATTFGEQTGQGMIAQWRTFWEFLFATFRDGGLLSPSKAHQCGPGETTNCTAKLQPVATEVGYDDAWRERIVTENPENTKRYHVPADAVIDERKLRVMSGKRH